MKIKKLSKFILHNFVLFVLSSLMASTALICAGVVVYNFVSDPLNQGKVIMATVNVARAEIIEEMPLRLWAMNYAFEQGVDADTLDCVIEHESNWNVNAYHINTNGSVDLGVAQWNTQHIKSGFITLECAGDARCALKAMIKKVKADKGFKSWYAVSNCK